MAKIQTLGLPPGPLLEIGQISQPANARAAQTLTGDAALTAEVGATGTAIFGGFVHELGEYNAELTWPAAYLVYEQMRRSDAQVAATLWASKLPIRGGEWTVHAPDKPNAIEQEVTDFVEQEFFDGETDFDATLENALLMFDFGASLHEDVWKIDGNRIRLAKLAPRLPLTFYRWLCDPGTDTLRTIEQLGYRAGQYVRTELPVEKCTLFTFRQEGANFTGRALLREMYQHWFIKSGLYRVDAISCERAGMGVPVVTMGTDVKREDRESALSWVQALTTHQRTGLVLPNGWTFALEGVKGNLRDPEKAIEHHGTMITVVGLAQFMMMGSSGKSSGNRSLGETMSDFFFMGLQATANLIGHRISDTTVKRLVDLNFAGVKRYPKLVPQQIMALKFDSIVDALAKLGTANIMTPTPELEAWLRERLGAPEADKAVIISERAKRTVSIPPAAGAEAGAPGAGKGAEDPSGAPADGGAGGAENAKNGAGSGGGSGTGSNGASGDAVQRRGAENAEGSTGKKVAGSEGAFPTRTENGAGGVRAGSEAGESGPKLRREPGVAPAGKVFSAAAAAAEKSVALSDVVGALDKGRDEIAAALRAARAAIQSEIIHKVLNRPVGQMHRASVAPDEALVAKVAGILGGVAEFGRGQVGLERAKQHSGAAVADAAEIRMDARSKDPLGLYADGVVSEFTNTLTARATNVVIDAKRKSGLTDGQIIQGVQADLDEQSDRWIDGVASKGANEAFAEGRDAGYQEYKDEIGSVVYSALLDTNTCEACAGADGEEGATPEDITDVPNPDCDGGDKCRCVHVYVFSDEAKSEK